MKNRFLSGAFFLTVLGGASLIAPGVRAWASGIVQSAYSLIQNAGTPLARRQTLNFTGAGINCADSAPSTTCTVNGSGVGGGGITVYSGSALTIPANTYFFPVGGGALPSTTETNVDVEAPSAATLTNFYVQMSVALGVGNSGVFTWRKAGSSQSLTCTISGAATTCNDVTHSFTVAQGDLLDVQLVTTGTIVATPNIVMAVQFGTTGSNGTVNSGTSGQLAYYAATGTAITGGPPASSIVNAFSGCSGVLALLANGSCGAAGGNTITTGAIASLPGSSTTTGNMYICTDSPYTFIWNGSAWDPYVYGVKVVQPVLANFTTIFNTVAPDTTHGGIIVSGTYGGGGNASAIAAPASGAYYFDMAFTMAGSGTTANGNFSLGVSNGTATTGPTRYMGVGTLGSGVQTQVFEVSLTNMNTGAGFTSSNISLVSVATAPLLWLRLVDDGTTNRSWYFGVNPYQMRQVATEGRTTQFTTFFVVWATQNINLGQNIHMLHFNQCTGAVSSACY